MNEREHLLQLATEECGEIIQAISKAQRFGMSYISPSNQKSNHDNIVQEFHDLLALMEMLEEGYFFTPSE